MGLDMYLSKRTYVKQWSHHAPEEKHHVTVKKGKAKVDHIKPERISYVIEEVAYWRKANAIHQWFVEAVQDGDDNCGEYYVSLDDLKNLLNLCKQVLDNPKMAKELLPTQQGFFFGGTEYDEYYFNDIEYTAKAIEELLEESSFLDTHATAFYYESSW